METTIDLIEEVEVPPGLEPMMAALARALDQLPASQVLN